MHRESEPDDWLKELAKYYIYLPKGETIEDYSQCYTCDCDLERIDDNLVSLCRDPSCLAIRALQK